MPKSDIRRIRFPQGVSRPVVSPIQPSVVYASEDADALDAQYEGKTKGYTYAREGHPNAEALAGIIDQLEGASGGIVVGSGMAAVTIALLANLQSGDHIIGSNQLYGRSLRLMKENLPKLGFETSFVDPTNPTAMESAVRPNTRMMLLETISNPTLRMADLATAAKLAAKHNFALAVDNTFTTPLGLRPFELGADIVIHSVTKLIAGHSDVTLGYVVAADEAVNEKMTVMSATMGFTPSPFDCWLAERGVYTLELRFERAVANADKLARALQGLADVKSVIYPGLPDHPDYQSINGLLGGFGGNMVSFELDGGRDRVNAFLRQASQLSFAPTLGDVNTTLSHPASSSHRGLTEDERKAIGISEGFIRVSVGCEAPDQLVQQMTDAIKKSS